MKNTVALPLSPKRRLKGKKAQTRFGTVEGSNHGELENRGVKTWGGGWFSGLVGFFVGSLIRLGFSGSFWCEFAVNFLKQNGPFNFKGILGPIFCLFGQTGLVVGEGESWCFFLGSFSHREFLTFSLLL